MLQGKIIEKNGKLYVAENWENDYNQPIKRRHYREILGVKPNDYPGIIGLTVVYVSTPSGGYWKLSSINDYWNNKKVIAANSCTAELQETEAIRPPRTKKKCYYRSGEWHKV